MIPLILLTCALWGVVMLRGHIAYRVGCAVIDMDPFPDLYLRLPSFAEMTYCHWDKWTVEQWLRWVK